MLPLHHFGRRSLTLVQGALLCLALGLPMYARAQNTIPPAKPADQVPAQPSTPNKATVPPVDQTQQPTPGASKAVADSVPDKVPIPTAVPSMMPHVPGKVLDRVVALVNGQIVLDSDVNEEHRFEAIQPYPSSAGLPVTRDREIERLINRDLILQQARLQTDIDITAAAVDKEIARLRETLPDCKGGACATDAGWEQYLRSRGFSVQEFHTRWAERMNVLTFIQERFGTGTLVTEGQVREFYQNTMLPQYKKAGTKPAPFTSVEPRIREILQQRQVSSLLRDWLQSLRAQGSIAVLHPGEEAP